MIPSAPKEILKCIFSEDASQFLASECDQSDEETTQMWYLYCKFLVQINENII